MAIGTAALHVRTITVVDTLKPVVALEYKGQTVQVSKRSSMEKHYVDGSPAPEGLNPTGMVHGMDGEELGFHYGNTGTGNRRLGVEEVKETSEHTAVFAALLSAAAGFALLTLSAIRTYKQRKATDLTLSV